MDTPREEKKKVECYKCQFPHLGGCGTPLCPNWVDPSKEQK